MKMRPKEILKNKSDKMIDLIADEVEEGGEKEITASFSKNNLKYTLTVKVKLEDTSKVPQEIIDQINEEVDDDL